MMTSSGDGADAGGSAVEELDEENGVRPFSDRLMTELTAHRTVALREAVANDPDVAFLAALHVLCLKLFFRYGLDSCLEIEPKSVMFEHAPGLADTAAAKAIEARHDTWAAQLPKEPCELWDVLAGLDSDSRQALFGHCVALTINAVYQAYDRRPKAIAHAGRLAEAVKLDMAMAGWRPTVEGYLGRISKARILDAVREAKCDAAAERIAHFKKVEMAKAAEDLLAGTGWVPEPLRTPGQTFTPVETAGSPEPEAHRQPASAKARSEPKRGTPARAEATA
jgi:ParB family chromosome partitioning protein